MRVLLTGATGFTGQNLAEKLSDNHDLLTPSHRELDLTIQKSVDDYFAYNEIDAVVHSAIKPMHRNAADVSDLIRDNLLIYYHLEKAVETKKVKTLFIGSGCCYDSNNYKPKMKESYLGEHIPTSVEGIVKYSISSRILHTSNIHDLRVFGLFGKYEDYTIRFISNAICKALVGLPITLRQNRRFDYLYISDLGDIISRMLSVNLRRRAYNITPDTSITLLELAQMVLLETHADVPIIFGQDGMGMEYTGDNSLLREEFADYSFTDIREAVKNLIMWYSNRINRIDKDLLLEDK